MRGWGIAALGAFLTLLLEAGAEEFNPKIGYSTPVENAVLVGTVHENVSNAKHSGSGFNPLCLREFPAHNLFRDDYVGLNFEHIFNGTAKDKDLAMFTPRKDRCRLEVHDRQSLSLHWEARDSAWAMDCSMRYTLRENGVDMAFSATPRDDRFPLGFAALMWASYMGRTRERPIHFYGTENGREQWVSFGEDAGDDFEKGTVAYAGVDPLPFEEGAQILNLVESTTKRFLLPFYYGVIDCDGDLGTSEDARLYVMMFDQREPIRFALWNFIQDEAKQPDPHSPAWDWQYVIRQPRVGQTYGYRARMEVLPLTEAELLKREYESWLNALDQPASKP